MLGKEVLEKIREEFERVSGGTCSCKYYLYELHIGGREYKALCHLFKKDLKKFRSMEIKLIDKGVEVHERLDKRTTYN